MAKEKGDIKGKVLGNKKAGTAVIVIAILTIILGLVDIGFFLVGIAAIMAGLLVNSAVIVPTVHLGIPTRIKKRIKNSKGITVVMGEGLGFVYPLVDDLLEENIISRKLTTKTVEAKATSVDLVPVEMKGSLQYAPSNEYLNVYIERSLETIEKGMIDAIESEFGKLCGVKLAEDFVKSRKEIELYINCILLLERPPHLFLNKIDTPDMAMGIIFKPEHKMAQDVLDKVAPEKWDIPKNGEGKLDILAFYEKNASRIKILIDNARNELSPVEKLYGIDVAVFRISSVSFSDAAQKAFEEKKNAQSKMNAAQERHKEKMKIIKDYVGLDLPFAEAVNLAESTTGAEVRREVISVVGSGAVSDSSLIAAAKIIGGKK